MVAVRLARGWVGYGGAVHRAGELIDVDAVTLAMMEASGVVTPVEGPGERSPGTADEEPTVSRPEPAGGDQPEVSDRRRPTAADGEDRT